MMRRMVGLGKPDGGVRHVSISDINRRMVAKIFLSVTDEDVTEACSIKHFGAFCRRRKSFGGFCPPRLVRGPSGGEKEPLLSTFIPKSSYLLCFL